MNIKNLKIGDNFTVRKNGIIYEYLGYCPIENVPCAYNSKKMAVVYFENENKNVCLK